MTIGQELAALRREYSKKELSKTSVAADPFEQFSIWMNEALDSEIIDATAMTLATAGRDARPSARVVLLKEFDERGYVFFTNYESKKSADLSENPYAALHFFWAELERQVAITGPAERVSREESEAYFKTRPVASQIGAWASKQSSILASRRVLEEWYAELERKFRDQEIPLPDFWGGFRIRPEAFEFWQGRESRLHDRICYRQEGEGWEIVRLSP